jgi:hypothetical protein
MLFYDLLFFLVLLLALIYAIKADLLFMILGTTIIIFLIFELFLISPLEVFTSLLKFIISNPLGLLVALIPLVVASINYLIKKLRSDKTIE